MSKESNFKIWKNRIKWAENLNKARRKDWEKAVVLYEAIKKNQDDYKIPELFSVISTQLPSLFSDIPRIIATPATPEGANDAILVEKIIEKQLELADVLEELQRAVTSAIVKDGGFVKVGVITDFVDGPVDNGQSQKVPKGHKIYIDYIPSFRAIVDPDAESFEASKFFAHILILDEDEYIESFGKNAFKAAKPMVVNTAAKFPGCGNVFVGADKEFLDTSDSKRFAVYEVWDAVKKRVLVFGENGKDFLTDNPWPKGFDSIPVAMLTLSIKDSSIYSVAEVLMLEDASNGIDDVSSYRKDSAESAQSGFLYPPGAAEDEQLTSLMAPGIKKAVEVNLPRDFIPYELPSAPRETFDIINEFKQTIQSTAHVSATVRQIKEPGKKTATEVDAMVQAANILTAYKIKRVEAWFERIVRKLVPMIREHFTVPSSVRVKELTGVAWYEWTGEVFGEYSLKVETGTSAFQNITQQLQQSMQVLAQVENNKEHIPNPKVIVEEMLKKQFKLLNVGVEIVDRAFEPPEPPPGPLPGDVLSLSGILQPGGGGAARAYAKSDGS